EHVAPQDPRTEVREALLGDPVVHAGFAIELAVHVLPHARRKEPLHQLEAAPANRILQILIQAGTVAVDRQSKTLDANFTHTAAPKCYHARLPRADAEILAGDTTK